MTKESADREIYQPICRSKSLRAKKTEGRGREEGTREATFSSEKISSQQKRSYGGGRKNEGEENPSCRIAKLSAPLMASAGPRIHLSKLEGSERGRRTPREEGRKEEGDRRKYSPRTQGLEACSSKGGFSPRRKKKQCANKPQEEICSSEPISEEDADKLNRKGTSSRLLAKREPHEIRLQVGGRTP